MTASIVVAMTLLAGGAQAPADRPTAAAVDDRWQPWLGCWRADTDGAGSGARTCVTPGPDGGVSIVTLVGVQQITAEARIADDRDHAITMDGCRGTERVRWSPDGRRWFRSATATCGGDARRTLSSMAFMLSGPTWVDVQAVQQGDETNVRVQRYRLSANQRLADGRPVQQPAAGAFERAGTPWTVADVIEISAALPPDAVQAAIGEGRSAFALNKRSLIALADAKVAERVIDLMVGLTYPSHFVVKTGGGSADSLMATGSYDPFFSPILGPASLYGCYSAYGWAASSYWRDCGMMSPHLLGYGPGYYNGYYGNNYPWVITSGGGSGGETAVQSEGRVVNGRGYTQVAPVDTSISRGDGGRWGGQSTGSGSGSDGSSGSSGASSGGYSGAGGGGDGGRMAMPRPPGL
jgi:uncharacterized membrane protein YgcG